MFLLRSVFPQCKSDQQDRKNHAVWMHLHIDTTLHEHEIFCPEGKQAKVKYKVVLGKIVKNISK